MRARETINYTYLQYLNGILPPAFAAIGPMRSDSTEAMRTARQSDAPFTGQGDYAPPTPPAAFRTALPFRGEDGRCPGRGTTER